MKPITLTAAAHDALAAKIKAEVKNAPGRKVLEFGSGSCTIAADLRPDLEYLACTDKTAAGMDTLHADNTGSDIQLIPDEELSEDCYFGRFHLVYTLFGFHDMPRLVDEVMRLRRLILKGGKLVAVDLDTNGFRDVCIRQFKRCGFQNYTVETLKLDGQQIFVLTAEK